VPAAAQLKLNIIPVVYMGDDNSFKHAVVSAHASFKDDLSIRITNADLSDIDNLNTRLANYLKLPATSIDSTYLVIDLKDIEDTNEYKRLANLSQKIIRLGEWKGFILASGSFPMDLSECKIDRDNFLHRYDWLNWKKHYERKDLVRVPSFSDYAIRHPIYIESYQFREATASVKYTLEDTWLVVKGKIRKFEYFLGAAAFLSQYEDFYGEEFSNGDKYIAEKALHYPRYMADPNIKGTGTTELWLKAGLNHHLSVVSGQLSSLA
jgi:hypothetical protein